MGMLITVNLKINAINLKVNLKINGISLMFNTFKKVFGSIKLYMDR